MTNRIIHFLAHGPEYKPKKAATWALTMPFLITFLLGFSYAASYGFQLYWANPTDFHPEDIVTFTKFFDGRDSWA